MLRAKAGISVGYRLEGLAARSGPEGSIVVTGHVVYGKDTAPPPVLLYSYLLRGTITDADGKPVKGAVVTTRTGRPPVLDAVPSFGSRTAATRRCSSPPTRSTTTLCP